MNSLSKCLCGVVLVMCCVALPASANSINTYNFSYGLSGGAGTVTGSFTYNSSTLQFTSTSLSFVSSIFGNVTLSNFNPQTGILYLYGGTTGSDYVLFTILLNPLNLSQFWVSGTITNLRTGAYSSFYTRVPEGGDWLAYLIPGFLVMLGGVYLKRVQSPRVGLALT